MQPTMNKATEILKKIYDKYKWKVVSPSWKANYIDRPFTLFPRIHMTKRVDDSTNLEWIANELVHEITHIYQQKSRWRLPFWLIRYFTSKVFRARVEAEAYGAEYKRAMQVGFTVDWNKVQHTLINDYKGAFTVELADLFATSLSVGTFDTIDWKDECVKAHQRKTRSDGR